MEASIAKRFITVAVLEFNNVGKNQLVKSTYEMLNRVHVHTKVLGGKSDFDSPIVLPKDGTLLAVAESTHKDWARRLKYALLWRSGKFDGQRIGRRFILSEGRCDRTS